jgi:hypothetical protein
MMVSSIATQSFTEPSEFATTCNVARNFGTEPNFEDSIWDSDSEPSSEEGQDEQDEQEQDGNEEGQEEEKDGDD